MYNENDFHTSPYDFQENESFPSVSHHRVKKRKRRGGRAMALVLCSALIGGAVGVGGMSYFAEDEAPVEAFESATSSAVTLSSVSGETLTPLELYANNVGACVGITVSNVSTNAFGQVSTAASSGSGFVITSDGYIVTNCHVIADVIDNSGLSIEVSFYDDSTYSATLVGYEEDNDVAVLKIEATGLQTVSIGDSDDLQVGETVYAIGNPLGELTFSLTDGLVSALDRLIATDDDTTMNMFQTNTAINPGNSGGPLFNESGEVIGITTAKYSTSSTGTSVEGLGFALPINDVVEIVVDLMEYGYVTGKPYMGVQVTSSSATTGAIVSYVAEGSAAESAGLVIGDIITAIDGTKIDSSSALTAALTAYSAYDSATLSVTRDGSSLTLDIVFDEKNTDTEAANQVELQEQTTTEMMPNMDNMPQNRP